jgi:gentisate 1,2-dioxygenase
MRLRQSFTFNFDGFEDFILIPSESLQKVALSADELCVWFGLEQIPQVEQLLNLLWAMKDEQDKAAVAQEQKDQEAIALERAA